MPLIKSKTVTVTDMDGGEHTFTISRFPATVGREIVSQWPVSAMPKLGDYPTNHALMLKMMHYVGVANQGAPEGLQLLTTEALVNNHCPDWECLAKVERAMAEHNISFFSNGVISGFYEGFAPKVKAWITSMLTDLLAQSSRPKPQP